jgi:hypothetical protein
VKDPVHWRKEDKMDDSPEEIKGKKIKRNSLRKTAKQAYHWKAIKKTSAKHLQF